MLWIIALVLLLLWGIGNITAYTMGGGVHLLMLFALAVVVLRLIRMRRERSPDP